MGRSGAGLGGRSKFMITAMKLYEANYEKHASGQGRLGLMVKLDTLAAVFFIVLSKFSIAFTQIMRRMGATTESFNLRSTRARALISGHR